MSATEFTPRTADIREAYAWLEVEEWMSSEEAKRTAHEGRAEFDRWLAAHDAAQDAAQDAEIARLRARLDPIQYQRPFGAGEGVFYD